jgi:peptidoglycan hydrolase-like protein with peptidoglycan-binding domain
MASVLSFTVAPVGFSQNDCCFRRQLTETQRQTIERMDVIANAQQVLKNSGFYYGDVSGIMNPQFSQALRDYQNLNELYPTGVLDCETIILLGIIEAPTLINEPRTQSEVEQNSLGSPQKAAPGSSATTREKPNNVIVNRNPNRTLAPRQEPQVLERQLEQVQQQLEQVQQQLQQVQQQPPQTPYPEQQEQYLPVPGEFLPPIAEPGSYYSNLGVGMGSVVEDIREAQLALRNRGFDPGAANGMLNAQTQDALRRFQAANNLVVTGTFDERTQAALGVTVRGTSNPDVH